MFKKITAAILMLCLITGLFMQTVFADEDGEAVQDRTLHDPFGSPQSLSMPIQEEERDFQGYHEIGKGDVLYANNQNLELYLDERQFVLKLLNKKTGYVWSSSADPTKLQGMSTEWIRFAQSMLVMDYIDAGGNIKRSALKHANAAKPAIEKTADGFKALVNFHEPKISLVMSVTLTDSGIRFALEDESIESHEDNKVGRLYIMPFFGAVLEDTIPGYQFVPDGSGALMRYGKSRQYNSIYEKRVYGNDLAAVSNISGTSPLITEAYDVQVPVFGAVHGHGQDGFVGIITGGDIYSEINASPAGAVVDYFWTAPSFLYHQTYWQSTGRTGGFTAIQPEQNRVEAEVTYLLLSGAEATYMGMASQYRSILEEQGILTDSTSSASDPVPIKIDALLSETEKALIGRRTQIMSTLEDVRSWTEEFQAAGMANLYLGLYGYEKSGANGHRLGSGGLNAKTGSGVQLGALEELSGVQVFLQTELSSGYRHQIAKSQLRYGMDGSTIMRRETGDLFSERYFATDQAMKQYAENLVNQDTGGYALVSFGKELYSDYHRNGIVSREVSRTVVEEILGMFRAAGRPVLLKAPNAYTFAHLEAVFEQPTGHSGYSYLNESVPFIQAVLSGSIPCFSEYQNFGTNTIDDVLRMIDYNTYPSYLLTETHPSQLRKTNLSGLYSSRYQDWKEDIAVHYNVLSGVLSQVQGARMAARTVCAPGVVRTDYNNGKSVFVNYNDMPYAQDGISLEAKSAAVIEVIQ